MNKFCRFCISAFLVFTFLYGNMFAVFACGPFTVEPIFQFTKHGSYPLSDYAMGKTGAVPNSYGRISLFVFYRHLNGLPFTDSERRQVVAAMNHRIGTHWQENQSSESSKADDKKMTEQDYLNKWLKSRAKVIQADQKIDTDKSIPDSYYYYTNCLGDSFDTAANTLEQRIAKYGISEDVKAWVAGQDIVFSNCSEDGKIPEEAGAEAPEWLRKDRKYQIAAAQFYSSKMPEARSSFEAIAADDNSDWKKTAKYVVVRTYIREASFLGNDSDTADENLEIRKKDLLAKAETQLRDVLADPQMQNFHASSLRLINLIKYRSDPLKRRSELGLKLAEKEENTNIFNDLTDYIWLLDQTENEASDVGRQRDQKEAEASGQSYDYEYQLKLRDIPADLRTDDLTDWLYTYQSADGFRHSFDRWKETGKPHWLAAAISKASKNDPETGELITEASKVRSGTSAYATVRYHQIRLLIDADRRAEAKSAVDQVLSDNFSSLPVSSQNQFYSQKMVLAENLSEFLKFAQRKPATFVWSDDGNEQGDDLSDMKELQPWQSRTMFDYDAVAFLNEKMPLSLLAEAAVEPGLPEHLKSFLVSAVWTRSVILGDKQTEKRFAPLLVQYRKEFAPEVTSYATARTALDSEARAMMVILKYPVIQPYVPVGMGRGSTETQSIDSIRGNWWCAPDSSDETFSRYDHYDFRYPDAYPEFLTAAQKGAAANELKKMKDAGDSATYLARKAVQFANANMRYRDVPELLHLAVRSTRYGCTDPDTETYSKQAFDILHKRFPRSPWTKKTPYWFK
ncbi:MAG: hypothetical protein R2681_14425 [Pyrinomonadaceae bacterium]